MVIPRSREAFTSSITQAYLNEALLILQTCENIRLDTKSGDNEDESYSGRFFFKSFDGSTIDTTAFVD